MVETVQVPSDLGGLLADLLLHLAEAGEDLLAAAEEAFTGRCGRDLPGAPARSFCSYRFSSARICWLTADWVTWFSWAAREKEPVSTTSQNILSDSSCMRHPHSKVAGY